MKRTIGVITNPTSGSGRGRRWGNEALAELTKSHKVRNLSRGSWAGAFEAAKKARRDLDALIVVGGDGMVHLGLQICANTKLPLGIVAAGSGNDAAVSFGLPVHEVGAAVRRLNEGLEGDVGVSDLGKLTGPLIEEPGDPRYFALVLSAGLDAAVAAYGRNLKYPRGPMKYKYATMREVPRFRPYGARVVAKGLEFDSGCTLIAVANSRIFGGGLVASPNSRMNDGFLEVVIAENIGRLGVLKIFPKLSDGSHIKDPRITVTQVTEVLISQGYHGAKLPAAFADGELVGSEPLKVTVAPKALRVLGARLP